MKIWDLGSESGRTHGAWSCRDAESGVKSVAFGWHGTETMWRGSGDLTIGSSGHRSSGHRRAKAFNLWITRWPDQSSIDHPISLGGSSGGRGLGFWVVDGSAFLGGRL